MIGKFTLRTDVLFPCVRMSGHWSAHVEGRGQKNGVTYSTYAGQRIKVAKRWYVSEGPSRSKRNSHTASPVYKSYVLCM